MSKKTAKTSVSKRTSYAAFLRGIGPGDPKKSNESLRKVFEKLGFANVRSFISSGNILFESPEKDIEKLEKKIEKGFRELSGIEIPTFIRSREEIEKFVLGKPFKKLTHLKETYLTVTMTRRGAKLGTAVQKKLEEMSGNQVVFFDTSFSALCCVVNTTNNKTTDFMVLLEKHCSKEITTRTLNTVERVLKKL